VQFAWIGRTERGKAGVERNRRPVFSVARGGKSSTSKGKEDPGTRDAPGGTRLQKKRERKTDRRGRWSVLSRERSSGGKLRRLRQGLENAGRLAINCKLTEKKMRGQTLKVLQRGVFLKVSG